MAIVGYSALPFLPYGRYKLLLAGIIDDPKVRAPGDATLAALDPRLLATCSRCWRAVAAATAHLVVAWQAGCRRVQPLLLACARA